jgi:hypothetical protein
MDLTSRVHLPTWLIFQVGLHSSHLSIQSKTRILFLEVNHLELEANHCHFYLMSRLKMHGVGFNSRQGQIFHSSFICIYSGRNIHRYKAKYGGPEVVFFQCVWFRLLTVIIDRNVVYVWERFHWCNTERFRVLEKRVRTCGDKCKLFVVPG